jgi:UDP-glucose:(heptosyl)LPS alpha-1,3-glucosyltransferase
MKIAMLIKHFNFRNGSSRAVHEIATRLIEGGHEIHIFCNLRPAVYAGRATLRHVPMVPIGSWAKVISFNRGCASRTRRERFDIVHGHGNTILQDVMTVRICRRANRIARGRPLSRWDPHLYLESRQFRHPGLRRIIVLSEQVRSDIHRYYGISPEKIFTIPNGVDATRFHPRFRSIYRESIRRKIGLSDHDLGILFVASGNFENRGLSNLMQAIGLPLNDRIRIVVAGGDRVGPYRKKAHQMGIEKKMIFLPFTDRLEELHAAADGLIFPSYYDTFGNVPLEAMASGLPVIVTAQCGMSELITNGRNGLVLKHTEDLEGMAGALNALEDADLRERLSLEARSTAERYSWDSVAARTLQVYLEMAAEGRTT